MHFRFLPVPLHEFSLTPDFHVLSVNGIYCSTGCSYGLDEHTKLSFRMDYACFSSYKFLLLCIVLGIIISSCARLRLMFPLRSRDS